LHKLFWLNLKEMEEIELAGYYHIPEKSNRNDLQFIETI
jgi:hypothetical protein